MISIWLEKLDIGEMTKRLEQLHSIICKPCVAWAVLDLMGTIDCIRMMSMCTLTMGVYLHNEMSPVAMVICPRDTNAETIDLVPIKGERLMGEIEQSYSLSSLENLLIVPRRVGTECYDWWK